jgi:hypothetical protein
MPRHFVQRFKNVPLFNVSYQTRCIGASVQYQRFQPVVQIFAGEGGAYLLLKKRFEAVCPDNFSNFSDNADILTPDFPLTFDHLPCGFASCGDIRFFMFGFSHVLVFP